MSCVFTQKATSALSVEYKSNAKGEFFCQNEGVDLVVATSRCSISGSSSNLHREKATMSCSTKVCAFTSLLWQIHYGTSQLYTSVRLLWHLSTSTSVYITYAYYNVILLAKVMQAWFEIIHEYSHKFANHKIQLILLSVIIVFKAPAHLHYFPDVLES